VVIAARVEMERSAAISFFVSGLHEPLRMADCQIMQVGQQANRFLLWRWCDANRNCHKAGVIASRDVLEISG
jgi:hypothetical protein